MKHYTERNVKVQGKLERGSIQLYLVFNFGYKQARFGRDGQIQNTYHPVKISTGQKVHPSNWQDGDFTATFRRRDAATANKITATIEHQRQKLFSAYKALLEKHDHLPSPQEILDQLRVSKIQVTKIRLGDYIMQHADSDICPNPGSKKKFRTLAKLVGALESTRRAGAFREHAHGRGDIYLHSFAEADWLDFETMLRRATCYIGHAYDRFGVEGISFKSGSESSAYAMNTVEKYQKNLLTILRTARRQKKTVSVDLDMLEKVKYHIVRKEYLNAYEINTLLNAKLDNPALDNVRRLFLLQLFTGVRVGDLRSLLQKPIVVVKGNERFFYAIKLVASKTSTRICIPLFAPALQILREDKPIWVSQQRQNVYLKEICRRVGINRTECVKIVRADGRTELNEVLLYSQISTHTARRSVKTVLEGHPLFCSRRIVAAFMGHSVNDGAADNSYFCLNEEQYGEALLEQVALKAKKLPFALIPEVPASENDI